MSKKRILFFCTVLTVIMAVCLFVACDKKDPNPSISFKAGTEGVIDGNVMSLDVGTTVDRIELDKVIATRGDASFSVCEDEEGKLIIPDKIVELKKGENVFYIVAKIGNEKKTYELKIWKNFKATIAFYINGELFDKLDDVLSHTYLDDFRAPESLEYGMEFLGWDCEGYYVEEQYKSFDAKIRYSMTSNVTLDANGGTCDSQLVQIGLGENFNLPVPVKDGYSFWGWKYGTQSVTDSRGQGLSNWNIENESVELVASWQAKHFTANFVSNNKDVSDGFSKYLECGEVIEVNYGELKKLGYRFLGWYKDDQKIGDGYNLSFTMGSSDVTIEMRWEYDVKCDIFDYTVSYSGINITGIKDKSLTSIAIPQGIYQIKEGVLSGCGNLEELTVPFVGGNSYGTNVLGFLFGQTSYNNSISVEQSYDHEHSFYNKTYYIPASLRKVTVLGNAKLDEGAFENCTMLNEVILSDGIDRIESYAFSGCNALEKVTLGHSVLSIGENAFLNCENLSQIYIPETVTFVGQDAFKSTALYDAH